MTGPEDTLARYRSVCDAAEPWIANGHATAEVDAFRATFDPPTVRKLLKYIEANETLWCPPGTRSFAEWSAAVDAFRAARRALGLGDA